jgi:acid phosphatase family membrane protein YuiD
MSIILSDYNVLLSALLSWFMAQVLKFLFTLFLTGKVRLERLVGAGGLPSSHSAMVCALTVAVARVSGFSSSVFALSFIFACVVMFDAMGVRLQAGKHAQALNRLMELLDNDEAENEEEFDDEKFENKPCELRKNKELKELIGHTPLQVLSGALVGILVAMAVPLVTGLF